MNSSTSTKERAPRASVIMMRGHGEERLRQAMMQGLVREELAADVEELLHQVEEARSEHGVLERNYRGALQRIGDYERIYNDAIRAHQREEARKKKNAELKERAIAVAIIFLIVLVSTAISRAIFG